MSDSLNRRSFLQTAAALTAVVAVPPAFATPASKEKAGFVWPENGTLVPDEGWRIWLDREAAWAEDDIFLPEDVAWVDGKLCGKGQPLAVNAPTGGWGVLGVAGKEVLLPTSVEQHFWGVAGFRPYTPEEYRYAKAPAGAPADDDVPQNGAYFGVSWWYRKLDVPASAKGKRIFLHVRGAHLRAEVYLNGKLCGYSIMEELPFEADLTAAANPGGENVLAIRITNPFGRFDWVDGLNAKWGKVNLYRSHGFGALDRGMRMSVHGKDCRIVDAWVLNSRKPKTVVAYARVDGPAFEGPVKFEVMDPLTKNVLASVNGIADKMNFYSAEIVCPTAHVWDFETPRLYHLRITQSPVQVTPDTRTLSFGFRSFTVDGVGKIGSGSNALFRLNGRRIKIYSSISWGFWGLNGMFPVPELAVKEVAAAKKLGLNCLNFHRNLAKTDVLRAHDEMGVLRYMEPGAGKMAIGKMPPRSQANAAGIVPEEPKTEADKFAQRYMFVKCVEMVKAHRSHPSVMEYCLQNELGADLKNPATLAVLKAMHDEDPSRMVVLNDGFVARGAAQAWYAPWEADGTPGKLHRSDEVPWGDFWNNHQGAGDQWYDTFYQGPAKFTYQAPYKEILTEYGEMEGCARPDVHGLCVEQITKTFKKYGGVSYDLRDHEEVIAGYNAFLDKWGFRKAFPAADSVFLAVGRTCYESWMNYMENARIADDLDFAAISGWESTAIENHSGIVDNMRNFKSDPKLIGDTLKPVRPIAKQRSLTVERGKAAIFDLYLANDTSKPVTGTLTFSMVTPSGKLVALTTVSAPAFVADQFSVLLKEAFETPALTEIGLYRFKFAISSVPLSTQTKEIWVTAAETHQCIRAFNVGVSGITPALRKELEALGRKRCLNVTDFEPGKKYDVIISSGITSKTKEDGQIGETTGEQLPVSKPGHAPEPGETAITTQLGHLQHGIIEAVQTGTPLLAIPQQDTLSDGVAKQLAAAGAFTYNGAVGDFRAPWMGNWYFVRQHELFAGMPVDQALGGFYQATGRQSNGLLVDGLGVEVVVAYSRDHDRKVGAGTFTTKLGKGKLLYHRVPPLHPVMQERFLANALDWLLKG